MIHFFVKHLRGWFKRPKSEDSPNSIDQDNEVPPPGFGHILITVCNDGDFTVATDIKLQKIVQK